ncbi:MAG: hypothetical protein JWQ43_2680 [Glaciihabitans sp.]|nr:hypothetical protein [Glaciihabitans sp.]
MGPVTIADLINFRPTPGIARMEPIGWGVVGLTTNFWMTSGSEVQAGVLLERQALVRFTPVSYRWDYGDGTGIDLGTSGAQWSELGVDEFGRTAVGHVYDEPGVYTVTSRVDFSAEYQYAGSGWVPLEGFVPSQSNVLQATVGRASPLLVSADCRIDPAAIGC